MTSIVRIGDDRVALKELLGQGSMANVFRVDVRGKPKAAKIYVYDGDPGKERMRGPRALKIPQMVAMSAQLPKGLLAPQQIILHDTGEFAGFTMDLMPKGYIPLAELYSEGFWARQLMTPSKVLAIMKGLRDFVSGCHKVNALICDFNPGNVEFNIAKLGEILGCDADSYQIPGFNGREIHYAYGAPRLFNKDLSGGTVPFITDDDWWSYYIHFVTGMTRGGHPFRGKGPWFKQHTKGMEVPERVLAGISIFHPEVQTIGGALPIGIMPDDVLQHLQTVLVQEKCAKSAMPDSVFAMKFKTCPTCKNEHARTKCPICHVLVFIPKAISRETVEYLQLFSTKHSVVDARIVGNSILCVVREEKSFCVHSIGFDGAVGASAALAMSIDDNKEYTVRIGTELIAVTDGDGIHLFDHLGKGVESTTSATFLKKPAFAIGDSFYRIASGTVLRWEKVAGLRRYNQVIVNIPIGSTWLQDSAAGLVFMTYAAGMHGWEVFQGKSRKKITVQKIPLGWHLIHQHVGASDASSLTIFRIIEDRAGHRHTLIDTYDHAAAQVKSLVHTDGSINQASCVKGAILFSSDEGLMVWKDGQAAPVLRPGTADDVQSGDAIHLLGAGKILVVRGNSIGLLTAK